jgi:hypothetical protein
VLSLRQVRRRLYRQNLPLVSPQALNFSRYTFNGENMASSAQLPIELWGHILAECDDPFDLWVTCRQLSHALRKEAEHVFRAIHLPLLRLQWTSRTREYRITKIQTGLDEKSTSTESSTAYSTAMKMMGLPPDEVRGDHSTLSITFFRRSSTKMSTSMTQRKRLTTKMEYTHQRI